MTTALQLHLGRTADGAPRLTAVGEIDLTNAADFAARLREAAGGEARVLIDLVGVEYLDSAALAALFAHADRLDIRISPLNEALLTVSGLDQVAAVEVVRP